MNVVVDKQRPDLGGNLRHGDFGTWCPELWRVLIELYGVRTMLDVGCGEGHTVAFFNRTGVYSVGIDGLETNVMRAVFPIAVHDLTLSPFIMPVDLVWSSEVAEHIPELYVDNYLRSLANGRVVAMTHALPGQTGHSHVNCQPAEYWIDSMKRYGYSISGGTQFFRDLAIKAGGGHYFANSGMVFLRD